MLPIIGAGIGLLSALPDLWDGVARIFGRQTPRGVAAAGDLAKEVGRLLAGGQATPEQQEKLAALLYPHQERIAELTLAAERDFAAQLTARHQADMASDSWLSKNCRPLVLLALAATVILAQFWGGFGAAGSPARYEALTELAAYVFGYYFIGRSAFDKGAVKLDWSRARAGGAA